MHDVVGSDGLDSKYPRQSRGFRYEPLKAAFSSRRCNLVDGPNHRGSARASHFDTKGG